MHDPDPEPRQRPQPRPQLRPKAPRRRSRRLAPLVVGLAACGPGSAPPQASDPPLDSVETVVATYLDAVSNQDTARVRSTFTTDGSVLWIENGLVHYRGVDGILEGLSAFPAGTPIATEMAPLEVQRIGSRGAHAWGTFTTSVGVAEGAYSFGGMISFLLEHDGEAWKLVGGHVSSPMPR